MRIVFDEKDTQNLIFEAILIGLYTNWLISIFFEIPFNLDFWIPTGGVWFFFTIGVWNFIRYFEQNRNDVRILYHLVCMACTLFFHTQLDTNILWERITLHYYLGSILLYFVIHFDPRREKPLFWDIIKREK